MAAMDGPLIEATTSLSQHYKGNYKEIHGKIKEKGPKKKKNLVGLIIGCACEIDKEGLGHVAHAPLDG